MIYQPVNYYFGQIVLGALMAKEVVLASFYNVTIDRVQIIVSDFPKLSDVLSKRSAQTAFHAFFYDDHGLHDITSQIRLYLSGTSLVPDLTIPLHAGDAAMQPTVDVPLPHAASIAPLDITVSIKAVPLDSQTIIETIEKNNHQQETQLDIAHLVRYLLAQKLYEKTVIATASSYFADVNGQRPPSNVADGSLSTSWLVGEQWDRGKQPADITLDLGNTDSISRLLWYVDYRRKPNRYDIQTSLDGKQWRTAVYTETSRTTDGPIMIVDQFAPQSARYIRVTIYSTKSVLPGEDNLAPNVFEMQPVGTKFSDIDIFEAQKYAGRLFDLAKNADDVAQAYAYIREVGAISFSVRTNSDWDLSTVTPQLQPVFLDGQLHTYSFNSSPEGTELREMRVALPFPASLDLSEVRITQHLNTDMVLH